MREFRSDRAGLITNAVGRALLNQDEGFGLRDGRLHIEGRDIDKELQQALATIIKAQLHGETSVVRALRVPPANFRQTTVLT